MKFTKYFMPFAALAVLASCSNDNLVDENTPNQGYHGSGNVSAVVNITLPNSNGSRAASLSGYDDGDEVDVANGTLYLFQKAADEGSATFVKSAPLEGISTNWETESNDITKSNKKATASFEDLPSGDYLGLIVLNKTESFKEPTLGQTYKVWSETILTQTNSNHNDMILKNETGAKQFTMTNAPKYNEGNVTVLVDVEEGNFNTESPIGSFYVQRGVAKVRLASDTYNDITVKLLNGNNSTDKVSLTNWALDYTNKKTFPVQVFDGLSNYFSVAHFHDLGTGGTYNRFHWAIDPNYTDAESSYADDFNKTTSITGDNNMAEVFYCLENTMNYDRMTQQQTTRAIFKGTYKPNGTAASFFRSGNTVYTKATLQDWVDAAKEAASEEDKATYNVTVDFKTGLSSTADATLSDLFDGDIATAVSKVTGLALNTKVDFYLDGVTYYVARIRHFSDEETKWDTYKDIFNKGREESEPEAGDAITPGTYSSDQTGRYGVLRNNVYEIKVNSVTGPGSPTIPTPKPGTPDDELNDNMIVEIYILDWVLRHHDYDLK